MFDLENMGEKVKEKLKYCGEGVVIYPFAKIAHPEVIEIGDHTIVEDFVFLNGGQGIKLLRYVHICAYSSVFGGGKLTIEDYSGFSQGTRVITGTDTYMNGARMNATVPLEQRALVIGEVYLEKDSFVGCNCVIHPNVRIGRGAVVGSNSLVLKDVEPWSIVAGSPCKKIGMRPVVTLPDV